MVGVSRPSGWLSMQNNGWCVFGHYREHPADASILKIRFHDPIFTETVSMSSQEVRGVRTEASRARPAAPDR